MIEKGQPLILLGCYALPRNGGDHAGPTRSADARRSRKNSAMVADKRALENAGCLSRLPDDTLDGSRFRLATNAPWRRCNRDRNARLSHDWNNLQSLLSHYAFQRSVDGSSGRIRSKRRFNCIAFPSASAWGFRWLTICQHFLAGFQREQSCAPITWGA
jgi:hypothetical protein